MSTDSGGTGATPSDPVETTITTPNAGTVSIHEGSVTESAPSGFSFFGQQVDITAPPATPQAPLEIGFDLSAALLPPGQSAATIEVFKDGALVPECPGATTAPPGGGACVSGRETVPPDGNVHLTVLTTSASHWNLAVAPFSFNANPAASSHPIILSKAVSLKLSKAASSPCSTNYGPACATPSTITVSSPAFGGTPNALVTLALCNAQVASPSNSDGTGGQGDVAHGCDFGNALGFGPAGVPNSGTLHLNASGNCCVEGTSFNLTLPSSPKLTQLGGPSGTNTNANAVCPTTSAQVAAGFTCRVVLAELDTANPFAPSHYAGYRQVFVSQPTAVTMQCGTTPGACPNPIPTGTKIKITGTAFPCNTIQADDPTTPAYDGRCLKAWGPPTNSDSTQQIQWLIKNCPSAQSCTTLRVGGTNPTTETTATNGNYTFKFTMPVIPAGLYKLVSHSRTCAFPCESGLFNTGGKLFNHS